MPIPRLTFSSRWTYLYAVAALLVLLNAPHILRELQDISRSANPLRAGILLPLIFSWAWIQTAAMLLPAVLHRAVLRAWSVFLVNVTVVATYFTYRMRLPIERDVLQAIAATDRTEFSEILDPVLIGLMIVVAIPVSILLLRAQIGPAFFVPWRIRTRTTALTAMSLALIAALVTSHFVFRVQPVGQAKLHAQKFLAPFNVGLASVRLTGLLWRSRSIKIHDISGRFSYPPPISQKPASEVVIVVVGESARSRNLQVLGYDRETTPRLAAERDLVAIPDVTACWTMTAYSVPCLLSRIRARNFSLPLAETSLIGVLRGMNFETHWLSTQNSSRSPSTYRICQEANRCVLGLLDEAGHDWDGVLIPMVRETLSKTKAPRVLIVLHTRGSHYIYSQRYPKAFAHFKPECLSLPYSCGRDDLVNSYDNTIRYTDHVLSELIDLIRDRSGALFYTSDHGQSLGERMVFGHGLPVTIAPRDQLHVPMLMWMSPTFAAARKLEPERIREAAAAAKPISHDHFFHTVLGCIGVRSQLIEPTLDLCGRSRNGIE